MKKRTSKTTEKSSLKTASERDWWEWTAADFAASSPQLTISSLKTENATLRRIIKDLSALL